MSAIGQITKKVVVFLAACLLAVGPLWQSTPVAAASYSLKVTSSLSITEDQETSVKQVFSVIGADKTNLPAEATINIMGSQPAGLKARAADGGPLTANYKAETNSVAVSIPEAKRSSAQGWSFSLNYKTELLADFGATLAAQIPALSTNLEVTSQTTVFAADLDLGLATVRGPRPTKTRLGVGQQILTFNFKGRQDQSILIVFGEQAFSQVKFSTKLENNSWWWQDVGLTLPPDTNQQRVIIDSIQPSPSKVKLDKDGNIVAYFRIGPLGSKPVEVEALLSVDNPTYQLDLAVPVKETDPELVERYTGLTEAWQPIGLELDLPDDATSAEVTKAVFEGVVAKAKDEAVAQEEFSLALRTSSVKMSDWLIGELRSRGLPARQVLGLSMSDGQQLLAEPRSHVWVEANLAGVGWVTLDPYLGLYGGQYGSADSLRVALGLWGIEDDSPPVDPSLAEVLYQEQAPEVLDTYNQLSVWATKYVILPFVSIFNQSVGLSHGSIVDHIVLSNQREQFALGSLAPYQQATQRSLLVGGSAMNSETVSAQVEGDDETGVSGVSTTSYSVLIAEVILAVLILLWHRLRKRSGRQPKTKIKRSKEALTLHDEALGGSIENENLVSPDSQPPDQPPPTNPIQ